MKPFRVLFSRSALGDLDEIYAFIAGRDGVSRAETQVENLRAACVALGTFPVRGIARDDLKKGLRIAGIARRANTAFVVDLAKKTVVIHGIFTGGRDIEKYFKRH